ncbi:MAG TPA: hypothetical protein VFZ76_08590 [Anaerolineales bacterium]
MKKYARILIAIAIFLSGVALVPFVDLPEEGFSWQRFANVYKPGTLQINYQSGSPGSIFTITGLDFPPNAAANVSVNGHFLGTVPTDNNGALLFLIDSSGAEPGKYFVSVSAMDESDTVDFFLTSAAPLRSQEDEGPLFVLPEDIAMIVLYLPLIFR